MECVNIDIYGVRFKMLPVEGGSFLMGATAEQRGQAWDNEKPVHEVSLSNYYLCETVVTQALWCIVMGEGEYSDIPLTGKSWEEWRVFFDKLNELTSRNFRMPTEAEWEYAARGGKQSKGFLYAGSNTLDEVAWFELNSRGTMHPVKQKHPNELGFFDLCGNVWEWCEDWYANYGETTVSNPRGPFYGTQHVCRGSAYSYYERSCRVSCRIGMEPIGKEYGKVGLRLAFDESEGDKGAVVVLKLQKKDEESKEKQSKSDISISSRGIKVFSDYFDKDELHGETIRHIKKSRHGRRFIGLLVGLLLVCSTVGCWMYLNYLKKTEEGMAFTVNKASFVMKEVEGGSFMMGASPNDFEAKDWEKPAHLVVLDSYYIGETEVTQELWKEVMGSNPSQIVGEQYPVNSVSWDDCAVFCEKLSRITGQHFRIPTEAEWEYAARGGVKSLGYKFSGGDDLDKVAWNINNGDNTLHAVKLKVPNELGLYDMTGNAWEICYDKYARYSGSDEINPKGPDYSSKGNVRRGAGWMNVESSSRVTYRYYTPFGLKNDFLSLRVAMDMPK